MENVIELVRARPVLWDFTLDEYRDNVLKDKTWEEVANLVNRDKQTVRQQWKKLRDCHRQALQRRKTATAQAAAKTKKWRFEDQMQFLLQTMAHRPSDSTVPFPVDVVLRVPNDEEDAAAGSADETELPLDGTPPDVADTDDTSGADANVTTSQVTDRRRRPAKSVDKIDRIFNLMREKYEYRLKTKQPKLLDDVDLFFASAAQSVRKLPRRLQNRVKVQVLNSIAAAEDESDLYGDVAVRQTSSPTYDPSPGTSSSQGRM